MDDYFFSTTIGYYQQSEKKTIKYGMRSALKIPEASVSNSNAVELIIREMYFTTESMRGTVDFCYQYEKVD